MHLKFIILLFLVTILKEIIGEYTGSCADFIKNILTNIEVNSTSLIIDWSKIKTSRNCDLHHVSFELWEVKFKPNNDLQDFDQPDYFDYYERCTKLDPSHFDFYWSKSVGQRFFPPVTKVIFQQVQMENQYILRLCPEKAGDWKFRRGLKLYDCDRQKPFKAQCIRVLAEKSASKSPLLVQEHDHETTNQCKHSKSKDISKSEFNLSAWSSNCTHLNVKGSLIISSCSPVIQAHHKVRMTFHKMQNENIQNCILGKNFLTEESISKGISIYETSQTRAGGFEFSIGLVPASKYCVTVVFVDHPYCDGQIRIDTKNPEKPNFCSALIEEPVSTFNCTMNLPEKIITHPLSNYTLNILIIIVLSIIILVMIGLQIWLWKKQVFIPDSSNNDDDDVNKISSTINCEDEKVISGKKFPVFLLHFLTSNTDHQEDVCCKYLREWMQCQSVVEVVNDIEDENNEEEINQDPEGWVISKLSKPDVRVVIVASKSTAFYLKSTSSPFGSLDEEEEDHQSDHSQQSLLSPDQFDDEEEIITSSSSDSLFELRIFALKLIQKYFIQNYRQLRIVSFDQGCPYAKNVAKMLTPLMGPFILPDHLPEFLGGTKVDQVSGIEQRLCNNTEKTP